MMRFRGAARLLQWWCDRAYQRARRIVVLSPGYRTAIEGRGIAPGKMRVVYNWTDRSFEEPMPEAPEASPGRENSTFTLMYAGNLGPMQSLGTVIEAARLLQVRHPCVRIQLVGDGIEAVALRQQAQALAVSNVEFLGRRPVAEVRRLLAGADASLIHLKDSVLTRMGIPSKTQASLAVGRPVIAALRGDARRLVEASGGGLVCDPEDPDGLAGAVGRLAEMPLAERQAWGGRARAFYLRELAFAVGVRRMMAVLEEARAASDRS
jgi:glycosyltransferase involved in cell wall biosynthesis